MLGEKQIKANAYPPHFLGGGLFAHFWAPWLDEIGTRVLNTKVTRGTGKAKTGGNQTLRKGITVNL